MIAKNTLIVICLSFITLSFCCFAMAEENASSSITEKPSIEQTKENKKSEQAVSALPDKTRLKDQAPEVGKHVMSSMDSGSMIISLMMVLALIILSAYVLKRFKLVQQGGGHLKVVASLPLGAKERVVVIQSGEKQLMLGVTPGSITLIEELETPLESSTPELGKAVFSFLKNPNKNK